MITSIDLDETVVAEGMRLTGARSKRALVDRALRELVARANRPSIRDLFGIGGVDPDYDPKAVWATGELVGQFRVEQPKASHAAKEPGSSNPGDTPARRSSRRAVAPATGRKRRDP